MMRGWSVSVLEAAREGGPSLHSGIRAGGVINSKHLSQLSREEKRREGMRCFGTNRMEKEM